MTKIKDLPEDTNLGDVRFIYPGDGQAYYWASQWAGGVWGKKNPEDAQLHPLFLKDLEDALEWEIAGPEK